jgi:hypothetical protein
LDKRHEPPERRDTSFAMQRLSTTLGFPRLGPRREVKLALESFWAGKTSEAELLAAVHACEAVALTTQRDAGARTPHAQRLRVAYRARAALARCQQGATRRTC